MTGWLAEHPELTADGQPIVGFLVGLNRRVAGDIAYSVRMEAGVQTPDTTLQRAIGSCRDSAWLLVSALRRLGPGRPVRLRLPGARRTRCPVRRRRRSSPTSPTCTPGPRCSSPGAGWIGMDPTSGLLAGEGHIPLAATPEPQNAVPISGAVDPWQTTLELVKRIIQLQRQLGDTRTIEGQRPAMEAELSEASRLLDYTEQFVPRP